MSEKQNPRPERAGAGAEHDSHQRGGASAEFLSRRDRRRKRAAERRRVVGLKPSPLSGVGFRRGVLRGLVTSQIDGSAHFKVTRDGVRLWDGSFTPEQLAPLFLSLLGIGGDLMIGPLLFGPNPDGSLTFGIANEDGDPVTGCRCSASMVNDLRDQLAAMFAASARLAMAPAGNSRGQPS